MDVLSVWVLAFITVAITGFIKLRYSNLNAITGLDDLQQIREESKKKRNHAIVCGGSLGGLLAARVLLNHFAKVTIIDPDNINDPEFVSKHVQHQSFIHVLRGFFCETVETLLPSVKEYHNKNKTRYLDMMQAKIFSFGEWAVNDFMNLPALLCTRLYIERAIRNAFYDKYSHRITLLGNHTVDRLLVDKQTGLLTGVRISSASGESNDILGEFVVDATGRSAKGVKWLPDIGYPKPQVEEYDPKLTYAVQYYEKTGDNFDSSEAVVLMPSAPHQTKAAYWQLVNHVDGDRVLVMLVSMNKDEAPNSTNFNEWIANLEPSIFQKKMKNLKPVSNVKSYKPGPCTMTFYHKTKTPGNFVAVGDSYGKFNPIFGQGAGLIALCVVTLDAVLRQQANDLTKVSATYNNKMFWRYFLHWELTKASDKLYPNVKIARSNDILSKMVDKIVLILLEAFPKSVPMSKRMWGVLSGVSNPMVLLDPIYYYELIKYVVVSRTKSMFAKSKTA